MSEKTAFYDEPAELAVLGGCMVDARSLDEAAERLTAEDFGRHHHGLLFTAMLRVHNRGDALSPITVNAQLALDGVLASVGEGTAWKLGDGIPRGMNIAAYAKIITDKGVKRNVRALGLRIVLQAEDPETTADALLQETEQAISALSTKAVTSDFRSGAEMAADLYAVVETLTTTKGGMLGVTTGLAELDRMTRGFQPGDLVLLGARPSMGKSAMALQVAMHAASQDASQTAQDGAVAFFSLEMGWQSLGLRGAFAAGQADGWKVMNGWASDADLQRVGKGLAALGEARLWIDDTPALSPIQAKARLRRLIARTKGLRLVVIDYLQLMDSMPDDKRENRTTQVGGVSRALKLMAREFNVPFLVLSQLNRGLERSAEKRPTMSDLRESGALEQDADVVLLAHRPEVYDPGNAALAGVAELIIGKQRNGPTGIVPLRWIKEHTRFTDAEDRR